MRGKKKVPHRFRDFFIILISTIVLGIVAEVGTRVVICFQLYSWPVTQAVEIDTEIRGLIRLYRRHPFLN
jgi:hypothetical protein